MGSAFTPSVGESSRPRVLIVEDEPSESRTLAAILRGEGFQTAACRTAAEALRRLRAGGIGVAVVDLRLPDLDGEELVAQLQQLDGDVQAVIHTAYGSYASAKSALNLGAFAYVEKGSDPEELLAHVRRAYQMHLRLRHDALEAAAAERTGALETANEALREREQWYRSIFEHSPEMIILLDPDGTILDANDQAIRWLGYSRENIIGKHFLDLPFQVPDLKPEVEERFARRLQGDRVPPYDLAFVHRDGHTRVGRVHATVLRRGDGRVARVLMMVSDVTEQKEIERALRKARDRAQKYLDIAAVLFIALDSAGNITMINRRACEILGYRAEELVGKNWFHTCLPAGIRQRVFDAFRRLMAGDEGPVDYYENAVVTREGAERLIAWHNTVLRDERGAIVGTLSSGEDITDRHRAEQQLRQREQQIAHMGRLQAVGEMATTLAHELNQPLSAIANYVHGIRRRAEKGKLRVEQLDEVLQLITAEVDRASGVIAHLREFVRKGRPRHRDVDMARLVADLRKLIEADTRRNGIRLELHIDQHVSLVQVDPIQIEQVLVNLVRNAIESMADVTGRPRTLTISAHLADGGIRVAVADTGAGMDAEARQRCFEPFFTTKPGGLGMGLPICRSIIEAHGGRIWITENQPQGTVVHWAIPRPEQGAKPGGEPDDGGVPAKEP